MQKQSKHKKPTRTERSNGSGSQQERKTPEGNDADTKPETRAIWSGSLGFGLLQIPVTLHAAVKPNEIAFHQLDRRDRVPIRYKRVNDETGDEVEWKDVVKGYEVEKGLFVVVDDEDLARVAVRSNQQIDIKDFVRADDILPVYYDTPYFLAPSGRSTKAFNLFREALKKKGLAAIATFVLRTREHVCAIFPMGDALVLDILRFQGELRDARAPGGKAGDTRFSPRELEMAEQLIDNMRSEWDPKRYRDTYKDALVALLEKKAKTGKVPPAPRQKALRENVVDLMALLKKSVSETRAKGGGAKQKRTRERAA